MSGVRGQSGPERQPETPRPVGEVAPPHERGVEGLSEVAENEVSKITQEKLKNLKEEVLGRTSNARIESRDRVPGQVKRALEKIEKHMKEIQNATLNFIDEIVGESRPGNEAERLEAFASAQRRLNEVVEKHSQDTQKYKELVIDALRSLSGGGPNDKLASEKVAFLNSTIDHIGEFYDKDKGIVLLFDKIVNNALQPADLDVICRNIHGHEYKKEIVSVGDEVRLNVTAFFVQSMSPRQRYDLVLHYHKWLKDKDKGGLDEQNAARQAIDFAKSLGNTGTLGLTQVREAIKKINPEIQFTAEDEKIMLSAQREAEKVKKELVEKLNSPKHINAAERLLNFRTIPALILTVLGVLGTATSILSRRKLSDPRTMAMMAAIGAGAHFTGKGMSAHPDTSPGPFSKFFQNLSKSVREKAESESETSLNKIERDRKSKLDQMAVIMRNHPLMNDFLVKNNGIKEIHTLYQEDFASLPEDQKRRLIIERLTEVMNEEPKNEDGIRTLQDAISRYGRRDVSRFLEQFKKSISSLPLRDKSDLETTVFSNNQTYNDYLRDRMGV